MSNENEINKGNYCLIIKVLKDCRIKIGAKGFINFKKGYYVYVGSALSSLSKRIERHLSDKKKKHWHADYLLLNKNTKIVDVIYTYCENKIECDISHEINKKTNEYIELFGCSDCNCLSHLYYFDDYIEALKSSIEAYEKNEYKAVSWNAKHI